MRVFRYIWPSSVVVIVATASLVFVSCIKDKFDDESDPYAIVRETVYVYHNAITENVEGTYWWGSPPNEVTFSLRPGEDEKYVLLTAKNGTISFADGRYNPLEVPLHLSDSMMFRFPLRPPRTPRVLRYHADKVQTQQNTVYNPEGNYSYVYSRVDSVSRIYNITQGVFNLSVEEVVAVLP